jgi:acyl-CoA thioester hydrolase
LRASSPCQTRWDDNDAFGHVNNVKYYAFFDSAVTRVRDRGRDIFDLATSPVIPYVVESTCTYFESVAFPEALEVGLAMERIGTSSLTYRLALFREGGGPAAAQGLFTHVYVDRKTERPVPLPETIRRLCRAAGQGVRRVRSDP